MPSPQHEAEAGPFAVLSSFNGKTEAQIRDHVVNVFDKNHALGGLATLKQLELVKFPINPTHKIIKSEIQAVVAKHLSRIL